MRKYVRKFLDLLAAMCIYLRMERDSRKIVQRLEREGWIFVSAKGSHHKFRKDDKTVIVPHPKKDLPVGTARSIAKLAGWL
jgi:predicted RNA binding protein YcfA (HicA-like mRNA interferase family)